MINFNNNIGLLSKEEILEKEIKEFNSSDKRKWMITGERYYAVDNDINERKIVRYTEDGPVEEMYKANNKLAHAKVKNLVDEKVSYLLSKEITYDCENKALVDKLDEILGDDFQYSLQDLGYESSNKGIAWLQVYISPDGKFKFMVIPAEQCIPLWEDRSHTVLQGMIRYYNLVVYEGRNKKTVTKIEYYTNETVDYYISDDNKKIILDSERYLNESEGPIGHYKKNGKPMSFGKVPFIAFKNNKLEYPDIKFIKSLVDNYDMARSDIANFIEETKNLIYVLKGYGGENLGEFMRDLNYYRAINIDDPESGGVDTLNPQIDITSAKEHFEQLKRDIIEDGQGVPKDLDKYGNSPSGIALKFMYSGLDLKCNLLEREYKRSWKELMYFINIYLSESGEGNFSKDKVSIIFNKDIEINETEVISNCIQSSNILSEETVISQHPWVKNIEQEMDRISKDKEKNMNITSQFIKNKIPIENGNLNEE